MQNDNQYGDLIDLGAVSIETRGAAVGHEDTRAGLIPFAGLSDE